MESDDDRQPPSSAFVLILILGILCSLLAADIGVRLRCRAGGPCTGHQYTFYVVFLFTPLYTQAIWSLALGRRGRWMWPVVALLATAALFGSAAA